MVTDSTGGVVVVGVDGSAGSRAALEFALREGVRRGATVQVVTTWLQGSALTTPLDGLAVAATYQDLDDQERVAHEVQDRMLAEVLAGMTERPAISQVVLHTYSGATLVDAGDKAALLVVGSGRKGVLSRALLGSVSEYCVRHSRVPVVVVPDPARVAAPRDATPEGPVTST